MPRYFTSAPHFTHMRKWGLRPKYTLAIRVRAPSAWCHFRHQDGSRTGQDRAVRPHSSVSEYTFGAFPLHGTARYGSIQFTFGRFSTGYSTWYFFSTAKVPSDPYRYQNVTCKRYWSLIGRRKILITASLNLRHETQHIRPARFKSAQPAKDRTQLFVSTKTFLFRGLLSKYRRSSRW